VGLSGQFVPRPDYGTGCPSQEIRSADSTRGNHGNQRDCFWADRLPQFIENLGTYHVLGSVHWRTWVHR
jgi:hypothetical protein